jgi:autotransporter passenger strand-loop-strand repeat protein
VFGTTSNTTVSSGGIEVVESGGFASGTTVLSGGEIVVYSGATISGLTLSGGTEVFISSGGSVSDEVAAPIRKSAADSVTVATDPYLLGTAVARLVEAMASFDTRAANQGSLFAPLSGNTLHEDTGTLLETHRLTMRR